MFRDSKKSELNVKHFGAGSLIKFGSFEKYLVASFGSKVRGVNLQTFELSSEVVVHDPNHLTEDEARQLVNACDNSCTFSDAELDAKGMK